MSEKITFIELDLDRCAERYGVLPCTASIPTTGTKKCFNCFNTCQDKVNYSSELVTVRYSSVTGKPPLIDAIPNIASVSIRPAKLDLGESIGIRASIDVQFKDHRSPDTGADGDYYLADRSYDPYTQGTYFGKFRARYPFTQGSNIRLIRGDTDQTLEQMETRHFIVDKLAGPDSGGSFSITCKDALKLADGKKSQYPKLDQRNVQLASDLLIGQTTFTISPFDVSYIIQAGITAATFLNIGGNEIVKLTAKSGAGTALDPYVYTCLRAQFNTIESDHEIGDRLQVCKLFYQNDADYILSTLLTSGASIPYSFIPYDDWSVEQDTFLQKKYTAMLAEPASVTDLINEILQQTASTLWWDDSAKLIRWRVLRAVDSNAATYNDDIIVAGSFTSTDQPSKRVSQVWTYYGQIDPTKKLDEKDNYATSLLTLSEESEANYSESSIKKIFSRWITKEASDTASKLNKAILSRYTNPPRLLAFKLQKNQQLFAPTLAGGYNLNSWTLQDDTGETSVIPIQTLQINSSDSDYTILAEEVLYTETITPDDPNVVTETVNTATKNLNMRSFFNAAGNTATASTVFTLVVDSGINIYSDINGVAALVTGDWPAGAVINLVVNGLIAGKGGNAGSGGYAMYTGSPPYFYSLLNGGNGANGYSSIEASYDVDILVNASGIIGGGGGGGGGGGNAQESTGYMINGSGGGGAAAYGFRGIGGSADLPPNNQPLPNPGVSATIDVGGLGGAGVIWDLPGSLPTLTGGTGGTGGNLGQNGTSGTQGNHSSGGTFNNPPFISLGGTGGLAGPAINKNGHTVTITNNGTIKGAINA